MEAFDREALDAYPWVGIATHELLELLRVDVVYPKKQTCCGQAMANSGC
jgi:L-lactate dehydrogenase complex protein LldE